VDVGLFLITDTQATKLNSAMRKFVLHLDMAQSTAVPRVFVCGVKGRLATDQRDFWVRTFKSCRIAFMSCNCLLTLAKRALSSSKLSLSS